MEITNKISKGRLWTSYIIQGIVVLMFLMGAINNLFQTEMAVKGAMDMGYPESSVHYLGIVLFVSTVLYAIPKTKIIGAILLTDWLGGAVATHIIHHDPVFNMFFPVIFGIIVWGVLVLRDKSLSTLIFG
jgi:DoxX-like family